MKQNTVLVVLLLVDNVHFGIKVGVLTFGIGVEGAESENLDFSWMYCKRGNFRVGVIFV